MPYKIVNTIERGKAVLTCVPSNWEMNGTLYWPPKGLEKLRQIEDSEPEPNWKTFKCIVKRFDIATLFQAEHEITIMCAASETDETENEESYNIRTCTRITMPSKVNERPQKTFDAIAQECILDNNNLCEKDLFPDSNIPIICIQKDIIDGPGSSYTRENNGCEDSITVEAIEEGGGSEITEGPGKSGTENVIIKDLITELYPGPENTETMNMLKQEILLLNTKLDSILSNQQVLSDTQQQIILNITKLSVQFEQVIKNSDRQPEATESTKMMNPINSLDDLIKFEQDLEDRNKSAELRKKYSVICGKGKGRGMTNAYQLIDQIFDRNFLMKCSWAGGSRSQEGKICFKSHNKAINFFFNIVHDTDNAFTLIDCYEFFKNILKNSKKRKESGRMRTSATKNRPKMKKIPNVTSNVPSDETLNVTRNVPSDETLNVTPNVP